MAARKKLPLPSEVLKNAFERKRKKNRSYSLRALSRDLEISPSFLSRILNGSKPLPEDRYEQVCKVFELDNPTRRLLHESFLEQSVRKTRLASEVATDLINADGQGAMTALGKYREGSSRDFAVLEPWYNLAILDLVTCADFQASPAWIAKRLGIRVDQAELAFGTLRAHGLIEERNGEWCKVSDKLRFPTTKSHPSIRKHHKLMMQKAVEHMLNHSDDAAFENRMITSITVAADAEKIQKARERLNAVLYEIAEFLSDGDCTEVFQLNAQLFPLTQLRKK